MEKELITSLKSKFDNMAHFDAENNIEFWYARELQTAFEYAQWRNFNEVIDKAKTACTNSEIDPSYHFADVSKQELIEERLENIRRMVERRLKAEDKKISKDVFKS